MRASTLGGLRFALRFALIALLAATPAPGGEFDFEPGGILDPLGSSASWQASCEPQGLAAEVHASGFAVTPLHAGLLWRLEVGLLSWGRPGRAVTPSEPHPEAAGHRATWRRDAGLVEWLESGGRGFEHGFTLEAPPPGAGPLVFDLRFGGGLQPVVGRDRRSVSFARRGGQLALLRYAELSASDAEGRALPARLELGGIDAERGWALRIVVDDAGARYPIEIDPLLTGAAWSSYETDHTFAVAWGDWDADGDLDLAASGYDAEPTRVYENRGGLLILAWSSPGTRAGHGLAWGDVDGDGDLDLAVAVDLAPNVLFENLGGTLTAEPVWTSAESDASQSVAWGDVDGDGDLDLAVANDDGQVNRLYENLSGLLETAAGWSSTETDSTLSVAWGDVDGDGDLDLAVGNVPTSGVGYNRIYLNEGDAFAATAAWSSDEADATTSVAWGDVDGDGDLDLAVGNAGGQPNRVYLNAGSSLATAAAWSAGDSGATNSVAWGDVDGDGDLDLAAGLYGSPNRVYLNSGTALAVSPGWQSIEPDLTYGIAWGDWDGDGDLDLAAANATQPIRVYENVGALLATAPTWSSAETDSTASVAWGDWDGDGDLDLAVGNLESQPNRVYENDAGALTAAWTSAESQSTSAVAWGDWDGDGDLDLASGDSTGPVRIYENSGGALASAWAAALTEAVTDLAWGDRDGDGDLDLAVGNYDQPDRVYDNLGDALSVGWTSAESSRTLGIAWGDRDGDGDLDLAVGNSSQQPVRVYENDAGGFAVVWASTGDPMQWNYGRLAWGDADGDGDLDLLVRNHDWGWPDIRSQVLLDVGGAFSPGWSAPFESKAMDVAWGDWDNDGDLDFALSNYESPNRVFENVAGTFALAWTAALAEKTNALAWGDWDGDGDLDLAVGNLEGQPNRLYQNGWLHRPSRLPESPVSPVLGRRPGATAAALFHSSPERLGSPVLVPYLLVDEEGDPARRLRVEYSLAGGGSWRPATAGGCGDGAEDLAASPTGTPHLYCWDAEADGVTRADSVVVRLTVLHQASQRLAGPVQRAAMSTTSPPFRLWQRQADLEISKTDGSERATPGAAITYTLVASNAGPDSVEGARVLDLLPAAVAEATWTCLGSDGGVCAPAAGSGDVELDADLPVGASITIEVEATVAPSASGLLVNCATISGPADGTVTELEAGDNVATDTDLLSPQSDLSVGLTDGTETAIPGEQVTYALVVGNAGPSDSIGAQVVDLFPPEIAAVTWTCEGTGGGLCAGGPRAGDILETVDLPVGGSVVFTAVASVDAAARGTLVNSAAVHAPATEAGGGRMGVELAGSARRVTALGDPAPGDNMATDVDALLAQADLAITKDDGVEVVALDEPVTWTIAVTNFGPSAVPGAQVTDLFPSAVAGVVWECVGSAGGVCGVPAGSGDLAMSVALPPGGSVTITASGTVLSAAAVEGLANSASVEGPAEVLETDATDNAAIDRDLGWWLFGDGFETGDPCAWSVVLGGPPCP